MERKLIDCKNISHVEENILIQVHLSHHLDLVLDHLLLLINLQFEEIMIEAIEIILEHIILGQDRDHVHGQDQDHDPGHDPNLGLGLNIILAHDQDQYHQKRKKVNLGHHLIYLHHLLNLIIGIVFLVQVQIHLKEVQMKKKKIQQSLPWKCL